MGALTSAVPPVSFNCFRIPWRRGNSSTSNWNRQMQLRLKWITAQFQLPCLHLYWSVYQNEATWQRSTGTSHPNTFLHSTELIDGNTHSQMTKTSYKSLDYFSPQRIFSREICYMLWWALKQYPKQSFSESTFPSLIEQSEKIHHYPRYHGML